MTCTGCQAKVQQVLAHVPGVTKVAIDLQKSEATIEMNQHVPTATLQHALQPYPKYKLEEKDDRHAMHMASVPDAAESKSWFQTYKPILLVFVYLLGITLLVQAMQESFDAMQWMRHFMAGFFLTFSFFKLLNLQGFAESYSSYDILARRWFPWGYVYAFVELALGVAFLINFNPLLSNGVTFVVMTLSIIGVLQSVLHKRRIQCACLGTVFNLPMSTVTIVEDGLMIVMSVVMLTMFF